MINLRKPTSMPVTRTSQISGITRTLVLDVTPRELHAYANGALLQDAFPHLSADEREFIKSGITAEEWDALFMIGEYKEMDRLDAEADARLLQQEE
jgi:hypothetical protein